MKNTLLKIGLSTLLILFCGSIAGGSLDIAEWERGVRWFIAYAIIAVAGFISTLDYLNNVK
jgi:hypothetical protein